MPQVCGRVSLGPAACVTCARVVEEYVAVADRQLAMNALGDLCLSCPGPNSYMRHDCSRCQNESESEHANFVLLVPSVANYTEPIVNTLTTMLRRMCRFELLCVTAAAAAPL